MNKTVHAAILGVVNALLAALLAFGIEVTDSQQLAVTGVVNAILILIAAWFDPEVPAFGSQPEG